MGRALVLGATCALALTVAACGEDEPAGEASEGAKPVRVAVVMASLANDFYVAQKAGIPKHD